METGYHNYQREGETAKPPISAVGLVIIHAQSGEIWMVQERKDKPLTNKKKGQWSIPLETLKVGESPWDGIRGAMSEAFDDTDSHGNDVRKIITESMWHMRGNSLHSGLSVSHEGRSFDINIAVMIYDGPVLDVSPFNDEEVENGRWVNPWAIRDPDVRPFTRKIGEELFRSDAYVDNLERYRNIQEERLPVFEPGFSIREAYHRREGLPDME